MTPAAAIGRSLVGMSLVLAASACHRNAVVLPAGVPYYQGKVVGSLHRETAGVASLVFSHVRVWLRNDKPTSLTDREMWADARLVVVDSEGTQSASR